MTGGFETVVLENLLGTCRTYVVRRSLGVSTGNRTVSLSSAYKDPEPRNSVDYEIDTAASTSCLIRK